MKLRTSTSLSLLVLSFFLLIGCKSTLPPIAGKWHGTSQMNATYSTTLNPKPRSDRAQIDFTLVLTQNAGTVQGEASVAVPKGSVYRIPIKARVVATDGKLTLSGDSDSLLSKSHFSFDGQAMGGKIAGTAGFGFANVGGTADCKGPITFTPAG
jgi:hypothetical protein